MKKLLILALILLAGCTQILYEHENYSDPNLYTKTTIKVNHFLVDPQYQGFEWVFSPTNWVAVNKFNARTNIEFLKMLNYLFEASVLNSAGLLTDTVAARPDGFVGYESSPRLWGISDD